MGNNKKMDKFTIGGNMRKALIVGIDNYPNSPLSGCVNDASAVAQCLRKNGDGSPNFDVYEMSNVQTKGELKKMISELFNSSVEIALFYFSGHGCKTDFDGYIVTPDYCSGSEGIPMTEILKIVNSSKSLNKIVILDCCYSGSFGNGALSDKVTEIAEGVTILTASMEDQTARESGGHGVFTNLLIEALSGGAANINGNITPGSIYSYIDQALDAWEQRPVFKTNTHSFVRVKTVVPAIELSVLRNIVDYFPSSTYEFKLDPSYEFTNNEDYKPQLKEPYTNFENVKTMKNLQKMESVGLIKPVDEEHLYFAAMNSKSCKLTSLGYHYWTLVKKEKI